MNKKVLLVGADLGNQELHNYFGMGLKTRGFTDYLLNPSSDWKDYVYQGLNNSLDHRICLSGDVPPNAPQLLSGKAFENFISMMNEVSIPVTDTLLIADYVDATLFVARAGVTDKTVLQEANELNRRDKLKNMAFVLNDTQMSTKDSYSYSYKDN
ncbi:hypothetical protein [uncultured Maribacter sp.]|uniref:hypothetical protein n=1 Tax=uncultured Maribacter sp. TaxID=431308 RepID=UPI0030D74D05|tara:strand:- start:865 stop:1329 length:465 start_codon:yes stop_codon:yes gene_type:complete